MDRILSQHEVIAATALSRATIWRKRRDGSFPNPVKTSTGRIGWRASAVEAWMAAL